MNHLLPRKANGREGGQKECDQYFDTKKSTLLKSLKKKTKEKHGRYSQKRSATKPRGPKTEGKECINRNDDHKKYAEAR